MKTIQNEFITFRCPNSLKEKLLVAAEQSEQHVSQVVRQACAEFIRRSIDTGEISLWQTSARDRIFRR